MQKVPAHLHPCTSDAQPTPHLGLSPTAESTPPSLTGSLRCAGSQLEPDTRRPSAGFWNHRRALGREAPEKASVWSPPGGPQARTRPHM